MTFHKVKFNDGCYVVAITDESERVITAGAFTNEADAETGVNIAYSLAAKCGLVDAAEADDAPQMTLDEMFKLMEESK